MTGRLLLCILLCTMTAPAAFAFEALAAAADTEKSKTQALAALAVEIQQSVEKHFCSRQNHLTCDYVWHADELPLFGVQWQNEKAAVRAKLDASSLPLYQNELAEIDKRMETRNRVIEQTKDNRKSFLVLSDQLSDLRRHQRVYVVAALLGDKNHRSRADQEANISIRLMTLEEDAPDVGEAVQLMVRQLMTVLPPKQARGRVHVHPPVPENAAEITPFSAVVGEALTAQLSAQKTPAQSKYLINGKYKLLNNGNILLSCQLAERHQGILAAHSLRLIKAAYQGVRAEPMAPTFDQLAHATLPADHGFRGTITSNKGSSDVVFKPKESFEIKVTLNQPGYLYVVGHVKRADMEYSYLLDLGDNQPQFVKQITAEQINREISLGEYEIEAPYGLEHLQMVASTQDLNDLLPQKTWDAQFGYYLIDGTQGNAGEGVERVRGLARSQCPDQTRGLKRNEKTDCKKPAAGTGAAPRLMHESVFTYTSMPVDCQNVRGLKRDCAPEPLRVPETPLKKDPRCDDPKRGLKRDC